MSDFTFYYWNIRGRNYWSWALAQDCGLELKKVVPDFENPEFKGQLPFGQVPFLVHGNVKLAQSWAIFRYLARHLGRQGQTDAEYALNELLTEEAVDLFNSIVGAFKTVPRLEAMDELLAPGGKFQTQLQYLEKLFPAHGDYFNSEVATDPTKRLAGGIAIAAVLDVAVGNNPNVLDSTPRLKKFYNLLLATPAFDGIKDLHLFYDKTKPQ